LVASFLSPFDLLRVSLVSRSLRAQARTVAAWESCLASHRPSAPLFYLESLKVLNTDTVVAAAMRTDPGGVSSIGEDLFEVAQELTAWPGSCSGSRHCSPSRIIGIGRRTSAVRKSTKLRRNLTGLKRTTTRMRTMRFGDLFSIRNKKRRLPTH